MACLRPEWRTMSHAREDGAPRLTLSLIELRAWFACMRRTVPAVCMYSRLDLVPYSLEYGTTSRVGPGTRTLVPSVRCWDAKHD